LKYANLKGEDGAGVEYAKVSERAILVATQEAGRVCKGGELRFNDPLQYFGNWLKKNYDTERRRS